MKENFWIKPLAVLLGIFSWYYVNIHLGIPITRDYKVKITYFNKDDSKNIKVIPEAPEVKIRVKGPRNVFIDTKVEENTFASVDLINCHGGMLTLPVNIIFPSGSNLQLVSKEPAQLVINAIEMATKKIDVKVNMIGSVPDGYLSSEPSVFPTQLTVNAPQNVIDTIKECRIDLYLDDIKRSVSEFRQAHIIYDNGIIESDLKGKLISIENNNVKVDLAVREGYPEKVISLKPEVVNKPPEGRKLNGYSINPDKVTISGSSKLLDKYDELPLESVDLSKINNSTKLPVKVILPNGLKLVDHNNVTMNIDYSDIKVTKTIPNLPFEVTFGEEQIIECEVGTYSIEIEGFIDDINAIKKDELKNIIMVKGLASGTHIMPVGIPYGVSERILVKKIIPESVPVTIRLLEKIKYDTDENVIKKEEIISVEDKNEAITSEETSIAVDNLDVASNTTSINISNQENTASNTEKISD